MNNLIALHGCLWKCVIYGVISCSVHGKKVDVSLVLSRLEQSRYRYLTSQTPKVNTISDTNTRVYHSTTFPVSNKSRRLTYSSTPSKPAQTPFPHRHYTQQNPLPLLHPA